MNDCSPGAVSAPDGASPAVYASQDLESSTSGGFASRADTTGRRRSSGPVWRAAYLASSAASASRSGRSSGSSVSRIARSGTPPAPSPPARPAVAPTRSGRRRAARSAMCVSRVRAPHRFSSRRPASAPPLGEHGVDAATDHRRPDRRLERHLHLARGALGPPRGEEPLAQRIEVGVRTGGGVGGAGQLADVEEPGSAEPAFHPGVKGGAAPGRQLGGNGVGGAVAGRRSVRRCRVRRADSPTGGRAVRPR